MNAQTLARPDFLLFIIFDKVWGSSVMNLPEKKLILGFHFFALGPQQPLMVFGSDWFFSSPVLL